MFENDSNFRTRDRTLKKKKEINDLFYLLGRYKRDIVSISRKILIWYWRQFMFYVSSSLILCDSREKF